LRKKEKETVVVKHSEFSHSFSNTQWGHTTCQNKPAGPWGHSQSSIQRCMISSSDTGATAQGSRPGGSLRIRWWSGVRGTSDTYTRQLKQQSAGPQTRNIPKK
jgi:hypothetical protein